MTMSNLFKSIYGTLDKSGESEKSLNAPKSKEEDEDKYKEGTNPPAGVEGEPLNKQAPAPSYMANTRSSTGPSAASSVAPKVVQTQGGLGGGRGSRMAASLSESLFPVITPVQKSLAQTHGYGDHTVDHVGKSCGVCGRLSKSLEGVVCSDCTKSMSSVAWHKSHLE
jgi:hypothetical protein